MRFVAPGLYQLDRLRISNAYLLEGPGGDRWLVDCAHRLERWRLLAELRRSGLRPSDLSGVLLTHRHSDHAGNARYLQERFGVPIAAHRADAEILAGRQSRPRLHRRAGTRIAGAFAVPGRARRLLDAGSHARVGVLPPRPHRRPVLWRHDRHRHSPAHDPGGALAALQQLHRRHGPGADLPRGVPRPWRALRTPSSGARPSPGRRRARYGAGLPRRGTGGPRGRGEGPMSTALPWWKTGVSYQIYPRSFMDSDGDGIGDLRGILDRLDYLNDGTEQSLGVDALWLSPFYPSPQKDFGYDIANFCAVDPVFGTMDDFRELVDQAHARGMRIIIDWVVNHTSDQHPWFLASRSSRTDEKRDWYLWRDAVDGRPPNNWASTFGGSGWTWDPATTQYYYHSFLDSQPDLNWRNPAVQQAILDAMQFWLDLGVDGFRHDVFNCYFKDADFRSNPRRLNPAGWVYAYIGQRHLYDRDQPEMREALDAMRAVVDALPDRMMVGETLDDDSRYARAASYCDTPGKGLHLAFNFHLLRSRWGARHFARAIRAWDAALPEGWPTWVLSNHDYRRQFSRFDRGRHGEARSKLAAILLMTLRGVPFLYYGEEIGMAEGRLRRAEIVDPPGKLFWPFFKGR
ncbi:MAG: MBL fold metallo-hydrolase, partial [Deltaproteobacteria bacterium]|nr:MBL fold metallo-hydrolase [Deltaproteobacteria bacterium]